MPVIRCMVGVNALAQAKYTKGAAENCPRKGNDARLSLQQHGKDTWFQLLGQLSATSSPCKEENIALPGVSTARLVVCLRDGYTVQKSLQSQK